MILTVTLNAALDVTYRVPRLQPHTSHRVTEVAQVAGGKGVNVASVLAQRGVPVLATGLLGGVTGELVRADLDARHIRHQFSACAGESRRAVTVVSEADGDATVFNEPGPVVQPGEWSAFLAHLTGLVEGLGARVVVASGSLPPGLPGDAYAEVVRAARGGGALSIVDTSGDALLAALAAGPDLVKPNRDELREVTREHDLVAGARALLARGARAVVVSAGADGLVAGEPVRRGAPGCARHRARREPHRSRRRGRGGAGCGSGPWGRHPRHARRRGGLVGCRRAAPAGGTGPPGRHRPPAPARAGRAGDRYRTRPGGRPC